LKPGGDPEWTDPFEYSSLDSVWIGDEDEMDEAPVAEPGAARRNNPWEIFCDAARLAIDEQTFFQLSMIHFYVIL